MIIIDRLVGEGDPLCNEPQQRIRIVVPDVDQQNVTVELINND